jgi:hypothetical protein
MARISRATRARERRTLAVIVLLASLCLPRAAGAEPGDDAAKKLVKQAMSEDYLGTDFRSAEARLKQAADTCVKQGCKPGIHASVYRYLAVVYAVGLNDQRGAVEAFLNMLDLDERVKPDPDLATPEVEKAYKAALKQHETDKKRESAAAAEQKKQADDQKRRTEEEASQLKEEARKKKCEIDKLLVLIEKPWTEQAIGYPIPVFVKVPALPETQKIGKVEVEYTSTGAGDRGTLQLKPHKDGYAGLIPCAAVRAQGEITYHTTVYNDCGNSVAAGGNPDEPHTVVLKEALSGQQPRLPGEVPPEVCADAAPAADTAASCESDDECPGSRSCVAGKCQKKVATGGKVAAAGAIALRKNRLGLFISPDLAVVSGDAVCTVASREDGQYSCFLDNLEEYNGQPSAANGGTFSTLAPGTLRLSLAYERVLGTKMTFGARAGLTLLGHPTRSDDKSMLPFHVEARLAYHFASSPFEHRRARPFAALGAGLADAAGRVGAVQVRDSNGQKSLVVFQKGGSLFAGLAGGIELPVSDSGAIVAELGVRQYFPTPLTTFAPALGYLHSL